MSILYIFSLLKNVMLIVVFNDYLKKKYPDKYEHFFVNVSFNTIYLYSLIQILLQNLLSHTDKLYQSLMLKHPRLLELIDNYHKNKIRNNIDFIKNGNIIYSTNKKNIQNMVTNVFPLEYDFIIYSDFSSHSLKVNNKIIYHFETSDSDIFEYIESNVKFISSEINISGETINVLFKTDMYNYYINNNIYDFNFILYFLKTHYASFYNNCLQKNLNIRDFKLNIIDNDVNMVDFDSENVIKICENNYQKVNNK